MANQTAIFKKTKLGSQELEKLQANIAEKFKKIDSINKRIVGESTEGFESVTGNIETIDDEITAINDTIANLPTSQSMALGTRISGAAFSQNVSFGSVSYSSSKVVEIGLLPDSSGSLLLNTTAGNKFFELLRNGTVINSFTIYMVNGQLTPLSAIRLYDLSPTGSSVTYSLRHNNSSTTMTINNSYIYAKEV